MDTSGMNHSIKVPVNGTGGLALAKWAGANGYRRRHMVEAHERGSLQMANGPWKGHMANWHTGAGKMGKGEWAMANRQWDSYAYKLAWRMSTGNWAMAKHMTKAHGRDTC